MKDSQLIVWKEHADSTLKRRWAVDLEDVGISDQELAAHFRGGVSAEEFAEWFARKYDLTELTEVLGR